ncbi:LPP20 family lipoprotein [Photobacterium sp. SDRW27]|uniref:LPP20 family lipoprotein n=1 Tax=Photobacterium obscurum TaxID=2829490 RepID=UPI002243E36A|nr:LPP20 family lipoprotein [Photobacterium obscurum]MCW8331912.1 LPP20 family lipoprotein [Photobacterium obscurum]
MKAKLLGALLCLSMLTGCQTTPEVPEWFINPVSNTNIELYSVGKGRSLAAAKKMAMVEMNKQLAIQVESADSHQTNTNDVNGNETYQTTTRTNDKFKTAPMVFAGVEYDRIEQHGNIYFVEAKISKDKIKAQLISELKAIDDDTNTALLERQHSDLLVWWLKHRDIKNIKNRLKICQDRLRAVSYGEPVNKQIDNVIELERILAETQNQLLIKVDAKARDKEIKGFIESQFSEKNISTTNSNNKKITHRVKLSTNWRQNKVGDAYISTVIAKLSVKNKQGKAVASSEVIASGNSVSNYKMSKEGASRHFSAQMSDKGIWHFLGFI